MRRFFIKMPQMRLSDRARRWAVLVYCPLASDEERKQVRYSHGKLSKHHNPIFRQKRYYTTRNEHWTDGLYLTYYPFGQWSERKQNAAFHEKDTEN